MNTSPQIPPSAEEILRAAERALRAVQQGQGNRDLAGAIADTIKDHLAPPAPPHPLFALANTGISAEQAARKLKKAFKK